MNKWIGIGNLGKDAETRYTSDGQPVTSWSMATSEKWKDKSSGSTQERTTWHTCVLWGPRGEKLQPYLTKGTKVAVEGAIDVNEYTDREGTKRWSTKIKVRDLEFVGGRQGAQTPAADAPGDATEPAAAGGPFENLTDDDIPF
jgi:single-strand DNA-binding protein